MTVTIDEQQLSFLVNRLEESDAEGLREKLDYITWLYGWRSAVEMLTQAISTQCKVSDSDIDKILSDVFENHWPPTSDYEGVINHLLGS